MRLIQHAAIIPLICLFIFLPAHAEDTKDTTDAKPTRVAPLDIKPTWNRTKLREALGVAAAQRRLGNQMPTGKDIVVGQVESGNGYIPSPDYGAFSDITFYQHSGHSSPSQHAQSVGACIYGTNGTARGIKEVHLYSTQNWLTDGYLKAATSDPPGQPPVQLFNHAWISTESQGAPEILRRADYAIDAYDIVMCAGVNNNRNTSLPPLLGQAHNVIAVGSAKSPGSSGGYTTVEGEGRSKPDIVGPFHRTSFTTGMVSGVMACLMEAAQNIENDNKRQQAIKPQTLKALLMTGALKSDRWSATPENPLDEHLGAGVVNLNRSLVILEQGAGQRDERDPFQAGWGFGEIGQTQNITQSFELDEPAEAFTATLVWHRKIASARVRIEENNETRWIGLPLMAHLNLTLWQINGDDERKQVTASVSAIDNVQHIYLPDGLAAGQYELEVTRRTDQITLPWEYAIAWLADMP